MADWWSDDKLVEALAEDAKQGNPQAMSEMARKLILEGKLQEGINWFEKAAQAGDRDAMFNLGLLYEQGTGDEEPDPARAYSWFKAAADQKDTEGMYKAASCLMAGTGTKKDLQAAGNLLKEALSLGYFPAQELLYEIPGMKEERERQISPLAKKAAIAESSLEAGQYEEAIPILTDLVDASVQELGEMDAFTIQLMNNLAVALSSAGLYEKSIPMKERVLELRGKSLPVTHPDYITAMTNLTSDYARVHRYQSALQFSRQAYTAARESLPVCNDLTFLTLNRYAFDLMNLCRHDQALEEVKKVTEEALAESVRAGIDLDQTCPHWKQTIGLRDLCMKTVRDNEQFFGLEESRRSYAYICAELMEMLNGLPESYKNKIDPRELAHYGEQASLAACYQPRMNQGMAVETDPYTNTLQTLLSYKYLMPGLAECREEKEGIACRALVSWIQNELCLIATLYPEAASSPDMKYAQPLDFVKPLNHFADHGDKVISIDSVDLEIHRQDEDYLVIRFAYGYNGIYRVINMTYQESEHILEGDQAFVRVGSNG